VRPGKHNQVRRGIAFLLLLYAALVAIPNLESGNARWEFLCQSLLATTLSVGVWRASEWARCACATVALLLAVGYLMVATSVLTADRTPPEYPWVDQIPAIALFLFLAGLWGVIGFHCLRPSTRRAFAQAREAMGRTR